MNVHDLATPGEELVELAEDIWFDVEHAATGDLLCAVLYTVMVIDRPAMSLYARVIPHQHSTKDKSWADGGSDQEKSDLRRLVRDINDRLADRAKAVRSFALFIERGEICRKQADQIFGFQSPGEICW